MPDTVMMMVATELYNPSQLHYQEPSGYFRRQLSPLQNVDKHIPFRFPVIILQSTNLSLATLLHQFTMLSHNYSSPNYWVASVYMCVSECVCVCAFLCFYWAVPVPTRKIGLIM